MKPASNNRKPYIGKHRSLVLALDIGTTFSGVSYAILEPGEVPKIHGVTRFPGQEHVAGNSKIPSIMYYDKAGKMKAAGAEAESASNVALAEDDEWTKAELFKLRLRPKSMKLKMNGMRLAPLPRHKTAVDVFGDFLSYLFRCTRSFIIDTHANGAALWQDVEHDLQFVLSHPNGWEGAQQTKMRRAAVYGGLIPDTDEGKARIRFVTEGEASLHACVLNGLAADVLSNPSGHGFIVADAGGGTLDISSYAIRGTAPLVIEEIAPPDCVFAGSVFVSRRARAFLEEKLKTSKYGTADTLDHITKRFDETTKRLFRDQTELQFVPFGSPLDKDSTVGIRGGQLKLTGAEVAALFEPSIEAAIASIRAQIEASGGIVKSVWLVGGFAASPWLFSQLQERLAALHVTVSRPDTQTSKAVADGAIGFYCDHHVSARMSKFMYGVEFLREFNDKDEDHLARQHRLFELPSGPKLLPDAFDCILARGVKVKESTMFSRKYCTEVTSLSTLSVFEVEIWCFRGGDIVPKWILRNAENFSTLCYVRADLSPLASSAQPKQGRGGKSYWTIVFSIEIHFGLTEFKARIKWLDKGETRYGPASIVYNESGHRAEEDEPDSPEETSAVLASCPDRHRSHTSSHAPSRDPAPSSSRSVQSSHVDLPRELPKPSPKPPSMDVPRGFERERTTSRSSAGHTSRPRETDKGKEREAPAMSSRDRHANISGRSTDSGHSARIGETLSAVWGAPSKHTTPGASPHVDASRLTPREEITASALFGSSGLATVHEASKVATPKEVSKIATPREPSRAATPVREPSRLATPVVQPATPREASKPATPREISKPPTPRETFKAATPKDLSRALSPKELSKVPTPKELSKPSTPRDSPTKPASKVPSKVPTPLAASRVPTPKVETQPIPEVPVVPEPESVVSEFVPEVTEPPPAVTELAPAAIESTPVITELTTVAPVESDTAAPPDPTTQDEWEHVNHEPSNAGVADLWGFSGQSGNTGGNDYSFGSWGQAGATNGDNTNILDASSSDAHSLHELSNVDTSTDPAPGSGIFTSFLSSSKDWGSGSNTKRSSRSLGGGLGDILTSFASPKLGVAADGLGAISKNGNSMFGSGWGPNWSSPPAVDEQAEKKRQEVEAEDAQKAAEAADIAKKAEEEAAAKRAEEATANKAAEDEAAVKQAEEAQKAEAEAAAKKAEEDAVVAIAKKAEEDAAAKKVEEDVAFKKDEGAVANPAADTAATEQIEPADAESAEAAQEGGLEENADDETKDEVTTPDPVSRTNSNKPLTAKQKKELKKKEQLEAKKKKDEIENGEEGPQEDGQQEDGQIKAEKPEAISRAESGTGPKAKKGGGKKKGGKK